MATNVFVGLAVTAHNNVLTNTAQFDSIGIIGSPPPPPASVSATLKNAHASLMWTPSPDAVSYNVKRATTNSGPYQTIISNLVATNYVDPASMSGTTYYYVVSSVNENGEGPNSNPASVFVTLPSLAGILNGQTLMLSWPASAPEFHLYSTSNLASPVMWMPVSNTVMSQGANLVVNAPLSGNASQYYRLAMPQP
jgi:hypothetical protein